MNFITFLAEGDTQIYVSTTGGIRRYDRFTNEWLSPITTLDGLPDNRVQRIAFDPNTRDLWFETSIGTGRWQIGLESVSLIGQRPPRLRSPRTFSNPPNVFPPFGHFIERTWIRAPRQDYPITDVLTDSWNNLWVGTWGLGVGLADLRDEQLKFLQYGPLNNNVSAIYRDGESIWIGGGDAFGSPSQGITRLNLNSGDWEYFHRFQTSGMDMSHITAILSDSTQVWFATHNGLMRYSKNGERWYSYRESAQKLGKLTALARDEKRLWLGTEFGLSILDLKADTIRTVEGSENFVIQSLVAGEEYIWAGTNSGLYRCHRGDSTWQSTPLPVGFAKRGIPALTTYDRQVWVATESPAGLLRLETADSTWQEFPLSEIGNSLNVSLAADTSRVWVGTDDGAFRLHIHRKQWRQLTMRDGLLNDRIQSVLLDGDFVWFGTPDGISRYHWANDFFE